MKQRVPGWPTLSWLESANANSGRRQVVYRGPLSGPVLQLHYGFDGWQEPICDVDFEVVERGVAVAQISGLAGHVSLEMRDHRRQRMGQQFSSDAPACLPCALQQRQCLCFAR